MESSQQTLLKYILQWADNTMILGQRLSEWCGHGPALEQDIAITNIALDLIGEARNLYQYAAKIEGNGRDEDHYPFIRKEQEFYNVLLVEQPNMDWAVTIVRQFMFDTFHYYFLEEMANSKDEQLAAIAAKSLKEARYHLRFSSEWMVRLGDGTDVSHKKMQAAVTLLYKFYDEMFTPSNEDLLLINDAIAADLIEIKTKATAVFLKVLKEATLVLPVTNVKRSGGKSGIHSEHMGFLLSTMQYMQRAYPDMEW
jgi:ring-1,2-phenylacetyl-CoA epoxidase subunit PaaC